MNNRVCPINIEPIEDNNSFGVEQGKDKTTISKKIIKHPRRLRVEPKHSKVEGFKSLGEILQSDYKDLFERLYDNEI